MHEKLSHIVSGQYTLMMRMMMVMIMKMTESKVHKTTFRCNDSLHGLTELRKAGILMVMVYHSEKIQVNISKGNMNIGQGRGHQA